MTRQLMVACATLVCLLAIPANAAAYTWETCTFDAASGTLTVTPEVLSSEAFNSLDESWNGSFSCGEFGAEQTIQLATLNRVVVQPQTEKSYVSVPPWLSSRAGHEIDVQINGRADLPDQRVSVGSAYEPWDGTEPGHQVHAIVQTTGADLDADGDLEYTVSPGLEWTFGIAAWRSWGTIDARAFRAPAKSLSSALLFGKHRSTIYAPRIGGGVDINTGDAADTIYGGAGPDTIRGGGGNDVIYGGAGNDVIRAEGGTDRLYGQAGRDQLEGGDGNDLLDAGPGDDYAFPDAMREDSDRLASKDDIVKLGSGFNMAVTKSGNDTIIGGPQTDIIRASGGVITIKAGAGRDVVDIGSWEDGTMVDCEAGIDWRRYPAGIHFAPQRHCERYTRKDPRRMPWRAVGIGIAWVT